MGVEKLNSVIQRRAHNCSILACTVVLSRTASDFAVASYLGLPDPWNGTIGFGWCVGCSWIQCVVVVSLPLLILMWTVSMHLLR